MGRYEKPDCVCCVHFWAETELFGYPELQGCYVTKGSTPKYGDKGCRYKTLPSIHGAQLAASAALDFGPGVVMAVLNSWPANIKLTENELAARCKHKLEWDLK